MAKIVTVQKLGSVASGPREASRMNKSKLLAIGADIALVATTVLYLMFHQFWIALTSVALSTLAVYLLSRLTGTPSREREEGPAVGVGTVVGADLDGGAAGEREIWVEVDSVHGDTFIGRLVRDDGDPAVSMLRPGLVVLVAFDPAAREELSLPDDVLAVRAKNLALA